MLVVLCQGWAKDGVELLLGQLIGGWKTDRSDTNTLTCGDFDCFDLIMGLRELSSSVLAPLDCYLTWLRFGQQLL